MKRPVLVAALLLTCAAPALRADERALNLPIGDPARKDREAAVVLDVTPDVACLRGLGDRAVEGDERQREEQQGAVHFAPP